MVQDTGLAMVEADDSTPLNVIQVEDRPMLLHMVIVNPMVEVRNAPVPEVMPVNLSSEDVLQEDLKRDKVASIVFYSGMDFEIPIRV
ncbi:hypothetical protein AMTR_s01177p00009730, partial [Amborella trichopoda]